jgi:hypothetical protein
MSTHEGVFELSVPMFPWAAELGRRPLERAARRDGEVPLRRLLAALATQLGDLTSDRSGGGTCWTKW